MHRSKRQRKEKSFGPNFEVCLIEGSRDDLCSSIPYLYIVEGNPLTHNEAISSQDSDCLEETINDEIDSIIGNNTLGLEDLPPR